MRPVNLKNKIFLDGGNPKETREIINLLDFLDGQTTNPTLISKNKQTLQRLESGEKFTKQELLDLYKKVVQEISSFIPNGSISIQVYADKDTKADEMLEQGRVMNSWIPNAHIKYPTTIEGIKAASESVKLGLKVNITLLFSQQQAAAIYCATLGAAKGQVYISPFVGRLDDIGENGMSLIENIIKMYESGDGHVQVLVASIRNMDHFFYSIKLGADILTLPAKIIREWLAKDLILPDDNFVYPKGEFKDIPYENLRLERNWQEFNIQHDLTDAGLEKFVCDWNSLLN